MEKYKNLNEEVLDDEKHPELLDRAKKLQDELMDLLQKFKRLAKSKGLRYDITGKKKSGSEERLEGISKSGSIEASRLSGERKITGASLDQNSDS